VILVTVVVLLLMIVVLYTLVICVRFTMVVLVTLTLVMYTALVWYPGTHTSRGPSGTQATPATPPPISMDALNPPPPTNPTSAGA
jgi:hypothetical protein